MALDLRTATPNRFRIDMSYALTYPLTICVTVRFPKSRRSQFSTQLLSGQTGVYSLPFSRFDPGIVISSASAYSMDLYQDVDGGCHYFNGMHVRFAPDGGRFAQVCSVWVSDVVTGLRMLTVYRDGQTIKNANYTSCTSSPFNDTLGPTPITGNASMILGYRRTGTSTFGAAAPLQIDEIVAWRTALNAAEVRLYNNITTSAGLTQGATGSTTTPIARYSFEGGSFANSVANSSLGDLGPVGYTGAYSLPFPSLSAANYSTVLSTLSNVTNPHGSYVLGRSDALYMTSGGFGRTLVSFCFDFRNQGSFMNLPCLDIDATRITTSNIGNQYAFCWYSNTTANSLSVQTGCCGGTTVSNAYTLGAWNRGCILIDGRSPLSVKATLFVNGTYIANTSQAFGSPYPEAYYNIENAGLQLPQSSTMIDELVVYDGLMSTTDIATDYNGFQTSSPTIGATAAPSPAPTTAPTGLPSAAPTGLPSAAPTGLPTVAPTTAAPTGLPSAAPTSLPTAAPSGLPTAVPSSLPSAAPTSLPSATPSSLPTVAPTTASPTGLPTAAPTGLPTSVPTGAPTAVPSAAPSAAPTSVPTGAPTAVPSAAPSVASPTSATTDAPTAPPTTLAPTRSPTLSPSEAPTAPPSEEPTALPTDSPSAPATSATPTAPPTAAPTVALAVVANVTAPDAPVTLALGIVTVTLELTENASTPVLLTARRLRAVDLASVLQTITTPFPADLVPVTGVVFTGAVPYVLRVTIDTSLASPYVAAGRTVRTLVAAEWVEPGSLCAPNNASVVTTVDGAFVTTYVCHTDAVLVVADPRGTTQRSCPAGKYSCDCTATEAFSAAPAHRALYLVSLLLHAAASVFEYEYGGRDVSLPFRALAYAFLIAAAALYPLEDTDTTWTIGGLDYYVLRYGLLLGPSIVAAAAFAIGATTRWSSLSRRGSQLQGTPLAWVGYDPFPNAPLQIKRFHRAIRWLHQVVLAIALAFAIELVWANGSVVVLVFLAGVFLETLTPAAESKLPECERRYYGLTRAIVVAGLLLCAAVLLAEPCGGSYGADRPATILA